MIAHELLTLSAEVLVQRFCNDFLTYGADNLLFYLAVLEQQQRGYSSNVETG
jgi:hypothetical protein